MPELLVVVAILGITALIAIPLVLSYMPGATVRYAARELQSGLNRAKLMAVTTRQPVCVQATAGGYRFFQNTTCTGTPRSEERRVGKEWRTRGWRSQWKKEKSERKTTAKNTRQ